MLRNEFNWKRLGNFWCALTQAYPRLVKRLISALFPLLPHEIANQSFQRLFLCKKNKYSYAIDNRKGESRSCSPNSLASLWMISRQWRWCRFKPIYVLAVDNMMNRLQWGNRLNPWSPPEAVSRGTNGRNWTNRHSQCPVRAEVDSFANNLLVPKTWVRVDLTWLLKQESTESWLKERLREKIPLKTERYKKITPKYNWLKR